MGKTEIRSEKVPYSTREVMTCLQVESYGLLTADEVAEIEDKLILVSSYWDLLTVVEELEGQQLPLLMKYLMFLRKEVAAGVSFYGEGENEKVLLLLKNRKASALRHEIRHIVEYKRGGVAEAGYFYTASNELADFCMSATKILLGGIALGAVTGITLDLVTDDVINWSGFEVMVATYLKLATLMLAVYVLSFLGYYFHPEEKRARGKTSLASSLPDN